MSNYISLVEFTGCILDALTIEGAVSRVGVFGVTTIALMSGFGAVYTPYKFMHFFLEQVDMVTATPQCLN